MAQNHLTVIAGCVLGPDDAVDIALNRQRLVALAAERKAVQAVHGKVIISFHMTLIIGSIIAVF